MIVIDTPGLLSAPTKLRHMNEQQRQLQQAAKEAEHLVLEKMKCQDYLILCVEVRVRMRACVLVCLCVRGGASAACDVCDKSIRD